jgi:hypothetical protein
MARNNWGAAREIAKRIAVSLGESADAQPWPSWYEHGFVTQYLVDASLYRGAMLSLDDFCAMGDLDTGGRVSVVVRMFFGPEVKRSEWKRCYAEVAAERGWEPPRHGDSDAREYLERIGRVPGRNFGTDSMADGWSVVLRNMMVARSAEPNFVYVCLAPLARNV